MKNIRVASVVEAVLLLAAGILLVVFPQASASIVCTILGLGGIIFGLAEVILFFTQDMMSLMDKDSFVTGMTSVLIGCLILFKKDLVMDLIPVILGLLILMSGLVKIQNAIVAKRIHYTASMSYLILGVICIVLGAIVMFGLSGQTAAKTLFTIIGIFLIFAGASDLYVTMFLSGRYRKFMKDYQDTVIDAKTENEHEADEDKK